MWSKVDFRKLGVLLIPPFLRTVILKDLLNVLTVHFETLNDEFNDNRKYNIERAVRNSQLCHLRGLLNDKFDYSRRIKIEDPNNKEETYIYTDGENKPVYLGEITIYSESEFEDKNIDFVVKVPNILKDYEDQIYATVDFYRLASKRFKIEFYEEI